MSPSESVELSLGTCSTNKERTLIFEVHNLKKECKNLKWKVCTFKDVKSNYDKKIMEVKAPSSTLEASIHEKLLINSELLEVKKQFEEKSVELERLEENFSDLQLKSMKKAQNWEISIKKIKRRDSTILDYKEKLKTQQEHARISKDLNKKNRVNNGKLISEVQFKDVTVMGEKECPRKKLHYTYMKKKLSAKQLL